MPEKLKYTGDEAYQPTIAEQKKYKLSPYLPDPDLVEAVNLAILLRRPLLLKGEPGCGKTRLAEAVAFELGKRNGSVKWPYFFWPVKSTSRARDGLYTFDAVGRLRDATLAAAQRKKIEVETEVHIRQYIHPGPLGGAFAADHRAVVLIDEIDKADIDFPNDLLIELDERRYKIDELVDIVPQNKEWIPTKHDPIIFITSNDEKDLPDAFLRRCLFHYIKFPGHTLLVNIVRAHCLAGQTEDYKVDMVETAVTEFVKLRERIQEARGDAGKRVSTSELIDWFKALLDRYSTEEQALERLADKSKPLPFLSVLLKNDDDQQLEKERVKKAK